MADTNIYMPGAIASALGTSKKSGHTDSRQKLATLFSKQSPVKRSIASSPDGSSGHGDKTSSKKKRKAKKGEGSTPSSTDAGKLQQKQKVVTSKLTKRSQIWRIKHRDDDEELGAKPARPRDPDQEARTVFVGNLHTDVTKKNILKLFKQFGRIESVRIRSAAPSNPKLPKKAVVIKKEFHPNKKCVNAYVVYKEEDSANKSLEMNGHELGGLHMRVDQVKRTGEAEHKHDKSIFIGNLPLDAQEEEIREHLVACGDILNVRVVRDSATGLGKGFGFVLFKDKSSVSLALKLHEEEFKGRKLRIMRSSADSAKHGKPKERPRGKVQRKSNQSKHKQTQEKTQHAKGKKPKKDKVKTKESKEAFKAHKLKMKKKLKRRVKEKQKMNVAAILTGKGHKTKSKGKKDT